MINARPVVSLIPHPSNIPKDKKLFIDATDPNAFTTVSGDISVANDKFGFADFTQTIALSRPTLNLVNKEIDFNDTNNHLTSGLAGYIFSDSDGLSIFALAKSDEEAPANSPIIDFGQAASNGYGLRYTANQISGHTSTDFGGVNVSAVIFTVTDYRRVALVIDFDNHQTFYVNDLEVQQDAITTSQLTTNEIEENPTRIFGAGPVTIGWQSKTALDANRFYGKQLKCLIIYANVLNSYFRKQLDIFMKILEAR